MEIAEVWGDLKVIDPVWIAPLTTLGIFTATQVGSLIWVLSRTSRDATVVKDQLSNMQEELKKFGNVLVTLADFRGEINLMNERQNAQGRRLDELQARTSKQIDELYSKLWEKRNGD